MDSVDLSNTALKDLTDDQEKELKLEYKLYKSIHTGVRQKTSNPYLPSFTGDDRGCKYIYWKETVKSLTDQQYDEATIVHAIRKSISGVAAKALGCLPFTSSTKEILEALDVNFGDIKNDAINWQVFYNAKQTRKESIVDWNIRLRDLWKKAPTVSIKAPEADSIIKSQLWAGLWSHEVKNSSRHQHDDHQVTSTQLLVYLRSIIDADTPVGERSALLVKDPHHTEMEELRNELKELKLLLQKKTASPPPYMGPSHGQPMRPHTPQPIRPFMGQPGNQQMMQPTHQPGPPMSHQMRQPSNQQMRGTRPTCYKCGKVGHVQRWCRVPQDRVTPTTRDGNQTVGIVNPTGVPRGSKSRRLVGDVNQETVIINNVECTAMIDTGSVVSSVSFQFYKDYCADLKLESIESICDLSLVGATGDEIEVLGYFEAELQLPGLNNPLHALFTVFKSSVLNRRSPALIGSNVIDEWKQALAKQYEAEGVQPKINSVIDSWTLQSNRTGSAFATHKMRIEPTGVESCTLIQAKLSIDDVKPYPRRVLFTPDKKFDNPKGVLLESMVIDVPERQRTMVIEIPALNLQRFKKVVKEGVLGIIEPIAQTLNPDKGKDISESKEQFLKEFEVESKDWDHDLKKQMDDLLWKHRGVFALNSHELGCCTMGEHAIQIDNHDPVKERYRRIPPYMYQSVKDELERMLKSNVISPSSSPWSSPVTIAIKKSGEPRVCVDFRSLNARTKKDAKAIPRVDDMLDALNGKSVFSSIDMLSGYWQVKMAPASRELTAFTAGPLGFYQFNRMPFGLCNAGATYQRLMEKVLQPLLYNSCVVYIDDVIVYSGDMQQHLMHLGEVFNLLEEYGLRLKPAKCKFLRNKLTFLGHQVSADGITKDPAKVEAIREMKPPTDVRGLRSFLGVCGFLRRYIRNYALIAKPLTELLTGYSTKKQNRAKNKRLEKDRWHWNNEHQSAFNRLKMAICEDVVLKYADFTKPFRLHTDASRQGLGAWIEQEEESGTWRPIAFASRRTSQTERNYAVHKLEFLALKWAITEKFGEYLSCAPFLVYTDNSPLTHVWKSANLDATGHRWVAALDNYDFKVVYKPGKLNTVADALSRQHNDDGDVDHKSWVRDRCVGYTFDEPENDDGKHEQVNAIVMNPTDYDWGKLQEDDETIHIVKRYLQSGEDDNACVEKMPNAARKLIKKLDPLEIHDNLLCYRVNDEHRTLVIPERQQRDVAQFYHDQGHFNARKVKHLIERNCAWTNMTATIEEVVKHCERCQKRKTPKVATRCDLKRLKVKHGPMAQLSMDFLNIDCRRDTKFKVLTVVDDFTKFGFAFEVKSENASNMAKLLYRHIYTKFGIPQVIHTDQGKSFLSKVIKDLNKMLGIDHTLSPIYHPQSNGGCERLNRTVIDRLGTLPPEQKGRWHEHLPGMMLMYNSTIHDSIGVSPFMAMFARTPRIPVDCMLRLPQLNADSKEITPKTFAEQKMKELQELHDQCAKNAMKRHLQNKNRYDKKCIGPRVFNVGDRVLVRKHVTVNKIDDHYQHEIHEVISQKSKVIYRVKGLETSIIKCYHHDHLVLFRERPCIQETPTHVDDIPSWHDTRSTVFEDEPEHVVKEQANKCISLYCGNGDDLSADFTYHFNQHTENEIHKSFDDANRQGATSAKVPITTKLTNDKYKHIVNALRRVIMTKGWDRITLVVDEAQMYNELLGILPIYFPKKRPPVKAQPVWTPASDDEESDNEWNLIPDHQPVPENDQESDTSDSEELNEFSDRTSDEEQSVMNSSQESIEEQPEIRHSTRVRRTPAWFKDFEQ